MAAAIGFAIGTAAKVAIAFVMIAIFAAAFVLAAGTGLRLPGGISSSANGLRMLIEASRDDVRPSTCSDCDALPTPAVSRFSPARPCRRGACAPSAA